MRLPTTLPISLTISIIVFGSILGFIKTYLIEILVVVFVMAAFAAAVIAKRNRAKRRELTARTKETLNGVLHKPLTPYIGSYLEFKLQPSTADFRGGGFKEIALKQISLYAPLFSLHDTEKERQDVSEIVLDFIEAELSPALEREINRITDQGYHNGISQLHYEVLCAVTLKRRGFRVHVIHKPGETRSTIYARHSGRSLVIQCVPHSSIIGFLDFSYERLPGYHAAERFWVSPDAPDQLLLSQGAKAGIAIISHGELSKV